MRGLEGCEGLVAQGGLILWQSLLVVPAAGRLRPTCSRYPCRVVVCKPISSICTASTCSSVVRTWRAVDASMMNGGVRSANGHGGHFRAIVRRRKRDVRAESCVDGVARAIHHRWQHARVVSSATSIVDS